jgi:hypothetical protein
MTATTILPPEADPIATLRTMAAFGMDEGRGIAEILRDARTITEGALIVIGLAILCKSPEKTPIPIFDPATRAVEVTMLADWLKARGYEPSACRWNRKGTAAGNLIRPPDIAWELVTGRAEVPSLPPEFSPNVAVFSTRAASGDLDALKAWMERQ